MFTLTDTPIMFVGLVILFLVSTGWSAYQVWKGSGGATRVSNAAHLVMSLAMLLMVPQNVWTAVSAVIPTGIVLGVLVVGALWFAVLGVRALRDQRLEVRRHAAHAFGHSIVFGAMLWHLSAMTAKMAALTTVSVSTHLGHAGHQAHEPGQTGDPTTLSTAVAIVGVPFMVVLGLLAVVELRNALRPPQSLQDTRSHLQAGHGHYGAGPFRMAAVAGFAMTFGMFWMSVGLLTPLIPALGVLIA